MSDCDVEAHIVRAGALVHAFVQRRVGSAHSDGSAARFRHANHVERTAAMYDLAADEHDVGPLEIGVREGPNVLIDNTQ